MEGNNEKGRCDNEKRLISTKPSRPAVLDGVADARALIATWHVTYSTAFLLQHHLYRRSICPRNIRKTFPVLVGHRHVLLPAINILLIPPHTNDRRLCLKNVIASSKNISTRTIFDNLTCLSNSFPTPTKDSNSWYHPSLEGASGDETEPIDVAKGNWGRKTAKGARWLRKGKLAAWGPGMEDWEVRF